MAAHSWRGSRGGAECVAACVATPLLALSIAGHLVDDCSRTLFVQSFVDGSPFPLERPPGCWRGGRGPVPLRTPCGLFLLPQTLAREWYMVAARCHGRPTKIWNHRHRALPRERDARNCRSLLPRSAAGTLHSRGHCNELRASERTKRKKKKKKMTDERKKRKEEKWKKEKRRMERVVAKSVRYLSGDMFAPRWRKLYCRVLGGPFEK